MKIFDSHGDLFAHFARAGEKGEIDIFKKYHQENFKKGEVNFGVFNVWIDDETKDPRQRASEILSLGFKEIYSNKNLQIIYKGDQFDIKSEKIQFCIGLEGADYLDEPDQIYTMYQLGVRLISLTWNHNNTFATSCTSKVDNGLSDKGREAIAIMNKLGIVIDISHLSDKSALEIIEISSTCVVASHSNVRNIMNHRRNLTDELIINIAKKGGVIGLNSYPPFISKSQNNIDGLIKHCDYIKNLVGVEHIGFGFDFMDYLYNDSSNSSTEDNLYIEGLKNHSFIQNLVIRLFEKGYSQSEVEKISHKNFLNTFKKILK